MASNSKVEMSLDEIIKKDRKSGPKKGGIVKKAGVNARKGKLGKKNVGSKRIAGGQQKTGTTAATKRLVQKLVKKALAQNNNNGGRKGTNQQKTRVVRQVIRNVQKPLRGVSRRSQVIKKAPRTETVIVRQVVQPRPQPRQQIIREVIVQEPRQRVISQPTRRFKNNNNRHQIVYVEDRSNFGGQSRSSFGGQQRFQFVSPQQRQSGGQRSFGGQQQQRSFGGSQKRFGGGKFQRQRNVQQRRNSDPFYEPVSFLQR